MQRIDMTLDIMPRVKRLNEMFPGKRFFLDSGYSMWALREETSGTQIIPFNTKRGLYEALNNFLSGIYFAHNVIRDSE